MALCKITAKNHILDNFAHKSIINMRKNILKVMTAAIALLVLSAIYGCSPVSSAHDDYIEGDKYDSIDNLMNRYYNESRFDEAISIAAKYYTISDRTDNERLKLLCATELARSYYSRRQLDSSLKYTDIADTLANKYSDTLALCSTNTLYGLIAQSSEADLAKSTSYLLKCLEYANKTGDDRIKGIATANLVMAYYNRRDIKGLQYAKSLYDSYKDDTDNELYLMGAVSCAFMYDLADSSETALRYIEEALKIYGDNIPSTIYALYGSILTNLGEYEKAEKILYEGMNKVSPDNIYQSAAELMMKTGRYNEAISLLRKSLDCMNKDGLTFFAGDHYKELSFAYEKIGDYRKALDCFKIYYTFQDSIFTIEKESIVNDMLVKYEAEQKDKEIQAKELQLVKESKKLQITIFILLISFIVIGAIYILYKKNNQMYRQIVRQHQEYLQREKLNKEKDRKLEQEARSTDEKELKSRELFLKIEKMMTEDKVYSRKDLTIESLTELLGSNRSYVSKIINTYSGMSFNNYVNSFRINRAVELLTETEMPVKVLVDELGFNSPSVFYRAFQQAMGVPPSKYREEAKSLKIDNIAD